VLLPALGLDVIKTMARRLGLKLLDLDAARGRACELVQLHRPAIEAVAAELLRRRTMSGDEVGALLSTVTAPRSLWVA
jgi:hypothetical protein